MEYVDLEPFRAAFEREARSGLTAGEVARRMDVDRERAAVLLGVKRGPRNQQRVTYEVAARLCRALDLWPVDVGI